MVHLLLFGAPVGAMPSLHKIQARHVAFVKDNCSRVRDERWWGLPADGVSKEVRKVEETSRWKTGKRRRQRRQRWQQIQVDLSATGDKLPNTVVAFLTCEVPSPPPSI